MSPRGRTRRRPTHDPWSHNFSRHRPPKTLRHLISAVRAQPRPVVARSESRRRPTLYPLSGVAYLSSPDLFLISVSVVARTVTFVPVVAHYILVVAHCGPVVARCATRRGDPSRACPAPIRASPISTSAFSHFSAFCQSIPACTCHGDYLRDSPQGASYFSSHVIHHY